MFDEFSIRRNGAYWDLKVSSGTKTKTICVSNQEAFIYADKVSEILEKLADNDMRNICKELE